MHRIKIFYKFLLWRLRLLIAPSINALKISKLYLVITYKKVGLLIFLFIKNILIFIILNLHVYVRYTLENKELVLWSI